ncbi:alanine/ornithine racemase family PLP-dependent enzyme [Putridiphycobacter roseus]|uniref:Alanine/ornithine racemase family PLP-dependent enzyme n=1 Tax=Putridiphycobacter roseus TaxID=2219161 RepID=A0A2W1N1X9_9FLAO|nr:alanine racemase [Putridiphycobacter roseus]PZE17804.1 alanine/ornithine racemase family PLP-dependent enzyme [Putridiphycobacter roseus]
MAELIIHVNKIKDNIKSLSNFFAENGIKWSLVTKVFSGDKEFLKNVLTEEVIANISSVGDSRLTSLKNLKAVNPNIKTIYIKPPAKIYAADLVKYADISLNSSYSTILAINKAAEKANKIHQIIIMIELGELREGVQRADIMDFYQKVFNLSNIEVIGIGSNLGCMYGVEPTYDKLLQLSLYKELISARFSKELQLLSGGTSITLPLVENNVIPKDINHFRIGEAAFFGVSPYDNKQFKDLNIDTFEFSANIIELEEKKLIPDGIISDANIGHTAVYEQNDLGELSFKAILDFGMLDVDKNDIEPVDKSITFVGITSDMLVIDLGKNKTDNGKVKYKVGDKIQFTPNYMAVARLLNSKFIDKKYN